MNILVHDMDVRNAQRAEIVARLEARLAEELERRDALPDGPAKLIAEGICAGLSFAIMQADRV